MTIGIAAAGRGSGAAILDALACIEAITEGAIGGFVSLAAMTSDGRIARARIQRGGARAMLGGPLSPDILDATRAVLMSSGPDRPEPLSQFTPARSGVGLVTGHRFPHARGVDGVPLAEGALSLLATGLDPQDAVDETLRLNPQADAGLILLSERGDIGVGNSRLVMRHSDLGQAARRMEDHAVAVIHNSITPHAGLAEITAELVERRLRRPARENRTVQIAAGLPVTDGAERSCIDVLDGRATGLRIATAFHGDENWSAGLGPDADLVGSDGHIFGRARLDPFLIVRDRRLVLIDGQPAFDLPYQPMDQ